MGAGGGVLFSKQTQGGWRAAVITGRWRTTHPCRRELVEVAALILTGHEGFLAQVSRWRESGGHQMCHHVVERSGGVSRAHSTAEPDVPGHASVAPPLVVLMG